MANAADFGDVLAADTVGKVVQERFATFLREYERPAPSTVNPSEPSSTGANRAEKPTREFVEQIRMMREYDMTTLFVDYQLLLDFDRPAAAAISEEYYRLEPFLRRAVQDVVREVEPEFLHAEGREIRDFFVAFFNTKDLRRIRGLTTKDVGQLLSFSGTVTRTSEVRPELMVARFVCGECGILSPPIQQQFKMTEPSACADANCTNRRSWKLDVARSKFGDWQRLRVQENADEIPAGSMPRSVDVILRHGAVDSAKAGDRSIFAGSLAVVPDLAALAKAGTATTAHSRPAGGGGGMGGGGTGEGVTGLRALGVRDLTYRTVFIAQSVAKGNNPLAVGEDDSDPDRVGASGDGGGGGLEDFTEEQIAELKAMASSGTVYADLVASLAPSIHGHEEIKKGLLLMLLSGVHKRSADGAKLRGDINMCIVGDPATAKSQFLKYAVKFAPRAIYTSGKASSAAGLTASVMKDPDTGEFAIEAGALMLADNGVCCIDEFDKMDPGDQVAIHEAMEQQTISVTKAGIQATLNARTSILAAANPLFGRYDRTKTLRQNVTISAPIMSRFDLFYIVMDEMDEVSDRRIADHIVNVHQRGAAALSDAAEYPMERLQLYVRYAKSTIRPEMNDEAKQAVINSYKLLRQSDALNAGGSSYRVTVRQLESLIRLSEALARLHLDAVVHRRYVLEAYRLLKTSMLRVDHPDVSLDEDESGTADLLGGDLGDDDDDMGGGGGGGGGGDDGGDGGGDGGAKAAPASAGRGAVPGGGDDGAAADDAGAASSPAQKPVPPPPQQPPPQRTVISEEAFDRMRTFFAVRLREAEEAAARDRAESAQDGSDRPEAVFDSGLPFGVLLNDWLDALRASAGDAAAAGKEGDDAAEARAAAEAEWASESEAGERMIARKVLRKLLKPAQGVLYFAPPQEGTAAPAAEDERFVLLAPDFVVQGVE